MEYKYQRQDYSPILKSTFSDIGDTIIGSISLQDLWSSLQSHDRPPLARIILERRIARARCHPILAQCHNLLLECMKAYHPQIPKKSLHRIIK